MTILLVMRAIVTALVINYKLITKFNKARIIINKKTMILAIITKIIRTLSSELPYQILPERGAPTINRNFRVCNSQRIVYSSLSLSRLFRAFALFEVFNVDEDADEDDRRVLLEKLKRFDVAPTGDLTVLILLFPVKFVTISSLSIRGTRDVDVVFVEEKR